MEAEEWLKKAEQDQRDKTLLSIHALSIDPDPVRACVGRALKALYEPFRQHIQDELKRGGNTAGADLTYGVPAALGTLNATLLVSLGCADQVMEELTLAAYTEALRRTIKMDKETPK